MNSHLVLRLNDKHQLILRIHSIINEMGLPWIAINSLALYLYGIEKDFAEIHVLISEDYHEKIHNQFSKIFNLVEGPRYQETNYFISNISSYVTDSIPIYLLSGIVIKIGNSVINPSFNEILSISKGLSYYGVRFLVPPLEWLFLYYLANPLKQGKVELITCKMKAEGINYNLLESFLRNSTEEEKKKIIDRIA